MSGASCICSRDCPLTEDRHYINCPAHEYYAGYLAALPTVPEIGAGLMDLEPAMVERIARRICAARAALSGDPPCYELEGTGPVDAPFRWDGGCCGDGSDLSCKALAELATDSTKPEAVQEPEVGEGRQDHMAFPLIRKVITDCVHYNGGTAGRNFAGIVDPEADVLRLLEECLGAEGVYYNDLKALDEWLARLAKDDLETVIDGEDIDVGAILATAPRVGEGTAREWIDATYEHCI